MGVEIRQGLDNDINSASNITGSATGWASRVVEVLEALKSNRNELGSAALSNAVLTATADAVPKMGSNGKIAVEQLPTATAGGSGSAGFIPILNASGQLPSSMVSGGAGGGGGGVKGIWAYSNRNQAGNTGSYSAANRQWSFTWTPDHNSVYSNATSILIIATGGGGSGAHGPPATRSDGQGGTTPGYEARKGGGGGAGSTVIAFQSGITSASSLSVKVGAGGDAMTASQGRTTANNGASSQVGNDITAGGGASGDPLGQGGESGTGGSGLRTHGIYLPGGSGGDGIFDRLGAGYGGVSFWGGGYSGGNGRADAAARQVAHGSGGGAANGSLGIAPYTFTANVDGKAGSHGVVVIIGFA